MGRPQDIWVESLPDAWVEVLGIIENPAPEMQQFYEMVFYLGAQVAHDIFNRSVTEVTVTEDGARRLARLRSDLKLFEKSIEHMPDRIGLDKPPTA